MNQVKKEKKHSLTTIVAVLVIFLALVQLFISHRLAIVGETVRESEILATQLQRENIIVEEEISQIGSLSKLSLRAGELGFVRTSEVLYLTPHVPVAMNR